MNDRGSDAHLGALLAPVAAAAAVGRNDRLADALDRAFAGGCDVPSLREAVLMLAPFAGFPRTLDALGALRAARKRAGLARGPAAVVGATANEERDSHADRGRRLFERVYGDDAERVMGRLLDLDAELPGWVIQDAYGRILARDGLSTAHRERLAVVLLCALGLGNQLSGHVRGALRCGATTAEVERSVAAAGDLLPSDMVASVHAILRRAASVDAP